MRALARILMAPGPEMPAALLEGLCVFRELESESAMDAIRDEAERQGLALGLGAEATPLDVVVRAWTLNQGMVESLHLRLELKRPRSFPCFSTDAHPLPVFAGPTPEQLSALEGRLNGFCEAWKRGKGARVFPSRVGDVWLFLVRHGAPCRREASAQSHRLGIRVELIDGIVLSEGDGFSILPEQSLLRSVECEARGWVVGQRLAGLQEKQIPCAVEPVYPGEGSFWSIFGQFDGKLVGGISDQRPIQTTGRLHQPA